LLLSETTYYPPIGAAPGDAIVFSFAKGAHAVVALPDEASWAACARPAFRLLAGPQDSPFRFVVPGPGTYYFACPVDDHCEEGMRVKVVASGTP
jgi:plastocyanin